MFKNVKVSIISGMYILYTEKMITYTL